MRLDVIQAGLEHLPVFENLLQLYIHDFCELLPQQIGEDGRYSYKQLPLYWSDASRLPFLARLDGRPAGFALVRRTSESPAAEAYDMAEFFILRSCRRRGIGRELARKVWMRCPGQWQIRVTPSNLPALEFWTASIAGFTGQPARAITAEIDGKPWRVFSFDARK